MTEQETLKIKLEAEYNITHWPKETLQHLFDLAWQYGHPCGDEEEVDNYYNDLQEFVLVAARNK